MAKEEANAKEKVKVKVEVEDKVEETTSNVEYMAVFTYGKIVQATELVPTPLEAMEEAKDKAMVENENTVMRDTITNHTTHSSINVYLHLLTRTRKLTTSSGGIGDGRSI